MTIGAVYKHPGSIEILPSVCWHRKLKMISLGWIIYSCEIIYNEHKNKVYYPDMIEEEE